MNTCRTAIRIYCLEESQMHTEEINRLIGSLALDPDNDRRQRHGRQIEKVCRRKSLVSIAWLTLRKVHDLWSSCRGNPNKDGNADVDVYSRNLEALSVRLKISFFILANSELQMSQNDARSYFDQNNELLLPNNTLDQVKVFTVQKNYDYLLD